MQSEFRRIAVLGDVHAEDRVLEAALLHLQSITIDLVMCVGDIVDGPGDVDRCVSLLRSRGAEVVAGNRDRWFLESQMRVLRDATQADAVSAETRDFLAALPKIRTYRAGAWRILLCHGLGTNDMAGVKPDDYGYSLEANVDLQRLIREDMYDIVLNGHTHTKMVKTFGGVTIVNAGSLKLSQDPGFAIVDLGSAEVIFFSIDSDLTIRSLDAVAIGEKAKNGGARPPA